ncbi:glycosyltransferase family 4 protein [Pseudarthrobacter phenanthrenivorans]|uniref:glycosyltransferase family 4 protein n=1 Tax=Pseudarthrobacter phenanthrenivorans TaxID=361575 RepID=UPI0034506D7B
MSVTPPLFYSPFSAKLLSFLLQESSNYDVAIFLGEASGVYVAQVSSPIVIWDKANVFTAFCINSVKNLKSLPQKIKFSFNLALSFFYERRVLGHCDHVWVTSPEEGRRLETYFSRTPDAVVRSSIQHPVSNPEKFAANSRSLVWMSTFAYPPNWDGLRRLVEEAQGIFTSNGLRLTVVGVGASENQVSYLGRFHFIDYVGYVEDLDEVFSESLAGIVPIWAGAGVKLKTITMMSRGLPVLSTFAGMEGVPLDAALCVSDSPRDLLRAVLDKPSEELRQASARAFNMIVENFSEASFEQAVGREMAILK